MKLYALYKKPKPGLVGRERFTHSHNSDNSYDAKVWLEHKLGVVVEIVLPDEFDSIDEIVASTSMRAFGGQPRDEAAKVEEVDAGA